MTLVIYDNTGKVWNQMSGNYDKPLGGVQYLEVEVPADRYVVSVNVGAVPHVAVLSPAPRDLVAEKLVELEERVIAAEDKVLMGLEAAVEIYEEVYPFLP
jgi:hypothetical protein